MTSTKSNRYKLPSHTPKPHNKNMCLITRLCPENDHFISLNQIATFWKMIRIGGIFVQPTVYASKQPPDLRQLLVRNTITGYEPQCNNLMTNIDTIIGETSGSVRYLFNNHTHSIRPKKTSTFAIAFNCRWPQQQRSQSLLLERQFQKLKHRRPKELQFITNFETNRFLS